MTYSNLILAYFEEERVANTVVNWTKRALCYFCSHRFWWFHFSAGNFSFYYLKQNRSSFLKGKLRVLVGCWSFSVSMSKSSRFRLQLSFPCDKRYIAAIHRVRSRPVYSSDLLSVISVTLKIHFIRCRERTRDRRTRSPEWLHCKTIQPHSFFADWR